MGNLETWQGTDVRVSPEQLNGNRKAENVDEYTGDLWEDEDIEPLTAVYAATGKPVD